MPVLLQSARPKCEPWETHCNPSITTFNVMPQSSVPLLQADEPKAEYWKTHCDPATMKAKNGGAHFFYLSEFLKRNGGGQGWIVGNDLSIAGQFQGVKRVSLNRHGTPVAVRSQDLPWGRESIMLLSALPMRMSACFCKPDASHSIS